MHDDLVPRDLAAISLRLRWVPLMMSTSPILPTKTLSLEDHLLHLCAHAHYHRFDRLFRLSDLLFIVRDHIDEINWELLLNLVSLEEAKMPVYHSFLLINQLFGFELPKWVLVKLKPDGFRRWWHKHFFIPKVTLPFDMQEEIPFLFKSTPWFQSTFLNLMIMGRRPEKLH